MKNRILILSPRFYPSIWGVEEQVKILWEEFIKKWYAVDVLTKKHEKSLLSHELVFWINVIRFKNELELIWLLIKESDRYNFIMSRHYYKNSIILSILKALWFIKAPTVICADSWGEQDEIIKMKNKLGLLSKIYFWFIHKNNYLNCINKDNETHLQQILWNSKKIIKIYNWINFWSEPYHRKQKITNILFLSRLIKEKGIYETIDAFKKIPNKDLLLTIVWGWSKEDEQLVRDKIAEDNRITYKWSLYWKEKEEVMKNSDLLVFPSYSEWQSVLLMEAAKYNLSVITTDIGDNREIYWDNMIYVKIWSSWDLREKIEFMINNIENFNYDYAIVKKKLDIGMICEWFLNLFNQAKS